MIGLGVRCLGLGFVAFVGNSLDIERRGNLRNGKLDSYWIKCDVLLYSRWVDFCLVYHFTRAPIYLV